ncbi:Asp23/Gls24 family envelope stress response protein [Romboutsia sp. CE17]|uniref:Asp23/Gls24 family envelope stress response protein n=1 Tax=Romboutsia sp. CE17 TaxID=2724150 RepID=UPI001442DFDC|nr:Asp23/Gls24 family envelope stress response protein [Romboutsia sp. CE17]QJA09188.1 Asp23/Gls24 family envelope stress response protein [Romboutsia sp. CE17]
MENNNFGQVKISNDVIATIAGLAALEVEGVETITTFTDKLLKNNNGVKIQLEEEDVNLDIMVMIDYGISIPDIALKIQENVKNTVETMTGLKVSQVNIHIQGISFKKEKTELEEAKKEAKIAKKEARKEESKKN